jgi:hypothetical protein
MSLTLVCLVKGNSLAHAFAVDVESSKLVSHLKKAIKEEKQNDFAYVDADKLKLWKVDIPLEEENDKIIAINTKINVNIQDELGGVELTPTSKISKHFSSQPVDEHINIIVQRPVETKEIHCTGGKGWYYSCRQKNHHTSQFLINFTRSKRL